MIEAKLGDRAYRRLKRITTSGTYIPEVDGLRFVAIAWVVIFHTYQYINIQSKLAWSGYNVQKTPIDSIIASGGKGVLIFFIISGFILAIPFLRQHMTGGDKVSIKKYYLRRLTRLEPPYIFMLLICFSILALTAQLKVWELVKGLALSLFYLHDLIPAAIPWINGVTWTLEIEIQFYLIAPLLFMVFHLPPAPRRLLLQILPFLWLLLQFCFPLKAVTLYAYLQFFLTGALIADIYMDEGRPVAPKMIGLLLPIPAFFVMAFLNLDALAGQIGFVVAAYLFVYFALFDEVWKKLFSVKWVTAIGGMCYSIYLWHQFAIYRIFGNFTRPFIMAHEYWQNMAIQMILLLTIELAAAIIMYLLIEHPCMDQHWPKKALIRLRRAIFY